MNLITLGKNSRQIKFQYHILRFKLLEYIWLPNYIKGWRLNTNYIGAPVPTMYFSRNNPDSSVYYIDAANIIQLNGSWSKGRRDQGDQGQKTGIRQYGSMGRRSRFPSPDNILTLCFGVKSFLKPHHHSKEAHQPTKVMPQYFHTRIYTHTYTHTHTHTHNTDQSLMVMPILIMWWWKAGFVINIEVALTYQHAYVS